MTFVDSFGIIKKKPKEKEVGNSFNKNEPVAPVIKKTFAKAYKEWLADEPVGGSGNVYMVWYAKEPNLADYADGRAFLAKKEAWEKKKPDYNAYLAKTNYSSDYEKWQAKEPKLADYTILVGTKTAEEKYNEDFAKWQELTPKPEDYIKYTSFETDYNAWLAAAPVPVEGKYETAEKAMEAYNKAHSAWETNMPKQSDYFDEEGYNKAVTEWTNKAPKKDNYHNYEGYLIDFESWKNKEPKQETYQNYFTQTTTLDIGWDGMSVALLGGMSAIGILLASLLFSILKIGGLGMQTVAGIPFETSSVRSSRSLSSFWSFWPCGISLPGPF